MVFGRKRKVVPFRSAGELDAMAAAGAIVGSALVAVRAAAKPGVSTLELNAVAESVIRDAGAVPSFLGYHGFTGSICSSVNDRVVHGIPSAQDILAEATWFPSTVARSSTDGTVTPLGRSVSVRSASPIRSSAKPLGFPWKPGSRQ